MFKYMGRVNLVLRSVFSDIFRKDVPAYTEFLNMDKEMGLNDSKYFDLKEIYHSKLMKFKDDLDLISTVEELIIQLRCVEQYEENLKLFFVNDYLYARTVFYRHDKTSKDIRVPVMKTLDLPSQDLKTLEKNKMFMTAVKTKIKAAIDREVEWTRDKVNKLLNQNTEVCEGESKSIGNGTS